jgi:hypothetical protein
VAYGNLPNRTTCMDDELQHSINLDALTKRAEALVRDLADIVGVIDTFIKASNPVAIQGQLKAVSDSIRKLERQGIAVPDELRRLKVTLASHDCKVEEVERVQARLVRHMNEALTRLGTPAYNPPATPAGNGSRKRTKGVKDEKMLDLFAWKAG